jgi:hypothetical protein
VTHAASGFVVAPVICTLRVPISMKKRTYSVLRKTVSTVKKSQAMMPWA